MEKQSKTWIENLGRALFAAAVVLAVLEWQEWQARRADMNTVKWLVSALEEWNTSKDVDLRDKLEVQMKLRASDVKKPSLLVKALPSQLLEASLSWNTLQRWRDENRVEALEWMATLNKPGIHSVDVAVSGWAKQDPDGAHRYLDSVTSGAWKTTVINAMIRDAMRQNRPQEAIALASRLEKGEQQSLHLQVAVLTWARLDPESALPWLEKLPASEDSASLIAKGAIGYAYTAPKTAAEWLLRMNPGGSNLHEGIRLIVRHWVEENRPEEAAQWVEQITDQQIQPDAISGLVTAWKEADSNGVAKWIAKLPEPALRAQATEILKSNADM